MKRKSGFSMFFNLSKSSRSNSPLGIENFDSPYIKFWFSNSSNTPVVWLSDNIGGANGFGLACHSSITLGLFFFMTYDL
jgi:hypothetical protein